MVRRFLQMTSNPSGSIIDRIMDQDGNQQFLPNTRYDCILRLQVDSVQPGRQVFLLAVEDQPINEYEIQNVVLMMDVYSYPFSFTTSANTKFVKAVFPDSNSGGVHIEVLEMNEEVPPTPPPVPAPEVQVDLGMIEMVAHITCPVCNQQIKLTKQL